MSNFPKVVVFFESTHYDMGALLLNLAAAAWRYERRATLLVDADPAYRLTRAASASHQFLPRTQAVLNLEDYFDAAARFDISPKLSPWQLSRHARQLIPNRGDVLGAHARALGAVLSTGGALDLGQRVDDLLLPMDQGIHRCLVLAPSPGAGLGALLGAHANQIVIVGDTLDDMEPDFNAIQRFCLAVDPMGPDSVLPLYLQNKQSRFRPSVGNLTVLSPVYLEGTEPEQLANIINLL